MIPLSLQFIPDDGKSKAWPELEADQGSLIMAMGGGNVHLAVLEAGMASGLPSLLIRTDLPNGSRAIAELSARHLIMVAEALKARYPALMDDGPAPPPIKTN